MEIRGSHDGKRAFAYWTSNMRVMWCKWLNQVWQKTYQKHWFLIGFHLGVLRGFDMKKSSSQLIRMMRLARDQQEIFA